MRLSLATVFSAFVALASAAIQPDYTQDPSGNAILKPGLNERVPVGKPYTIKWTPSTEGPISLVLLRGPSTNVVPIETLAEAIPNSGSFTWTPSTSLEPDTTHYGLLLVVDGTGQYQYSTQFGISNPDYVPSSSASVDPTQSASKSEASGTATATATATATGSGSSSGSASESTPAATQSATTLITQGTTDVPTSTVAITSPAETTVTSSVVVSSTGNSASATPTPSTILSNGADRNAISLAAVVMGAFAVVAF